MTTTFLSFCNTISTTILYLITMKIECKIKEIKSTFQQNQNYLKMMYKLKVMNKIVAWYPNTRLQICTQKFQLSTCNNINFLELICMHH